MGLHVDIDAIYEDNSKKICKRKQGFIVNDGDKLTPEQKLALKAFNQEKYGLDQEYIDNVLKLPPKGKCKVYETDKIVNSRKRMPTTEKIEHLLTLKETLEKRLQIIQRGDKLKGFQVEKYRDWKERI